MNRLLVLLFFLHGSSTCLWSQLTVQITESKDPSCHGSVDGTATVGISGGTEDIESLGEGMYNLDLTDASGCVTNFQQAVLDEDPISLSYTLSSYEEYNLECYGDHSGSIKIDRVTGNGLDWRNYTYIWNGPGGFKSYVYEIDSL